jgi:leucyl-tRNA synthetase
MKELPIHLRFARTLRKNQTPEEEKLWERLRGRKLNGYKFLRQHPLFICPFRDQPAFYIADFYCAEKKLVVEVDGAIHAFQMDYDMARDLIMNEKGITVFRISNVEVNSNIENVIEKIAEFLN